MKSEYSNQELDEMIADYMEKGFLDNIVDMFTQDTTLYPIIAKLITDERIRVRMGAIALIESLVELEAANLDNAADFIIPLLDNESAAVKGDAAYSIGMIGTERHIPHLNKLLKDENSDVRESAEEAVADINNRFN